jgi:hypothetical protein
VPKHAAGIPESLRNFDELPDSAIVRVGVVAALYDCQPVTIWRWSKSGRLPAPDRIGGITGWNVGKLRAARRQQAA